MSDSKISDLSTSTALTGTEEVAIVQGGNTVKTTAQDIADLSTGGGSTVFTIDLIDALTVTFYAPEALSIDSVTDIVNSPTTTILVGGSAYTLGAAITAGQSINITVSTNAVVNLITS